MTHKCGYKAMILKKKYKYPYKSISIKARQIRMAINDKQIVQSLTNVKC